jgi:hypothetical protein
MIFWSSHHGRKREYLIPFAFAALALLGAAPSQACSGRIASAPEPLADYNPFSPLDHVHSFQVRVENTGSETCRFQLSLEPGLMEIQFDYRIDGGTGSHLADSRRAGDHFAALTSRPLAAGEHQQFDLMLKIPAGQILGPGRYTAELSLSLTGSDGDAEPITGAPPIDSVAMRVICAVGDHLGVNIAGAGIAKTVDFGELVEGDSRHIVVEARANRNFILEIVSAKGGAMAMAAPYEQWRIPYALTLDGRGLKLPFRAGPFLNAGISGKAFSFDFQIGDVSAKRAGLYTDEITVTIRPAL